MGAPRLKESAAIATGGRLPACASPGRCQVSIEIEERPVDSPLIASIWRSRSEQGGSFTSVAVSRWELVTRQRGRARLTLRGPETRPTPAPIPEEAEFLGWSLRRFIGHTPTAIGRADAGPLMSLSYKTAEFRDAIDQP